MRPGQVSIELRWMLDQLVYQTGCAMEPLTVRFASAEAKHSQKLFKPPNNMDIPLPTCLTKGSVFLGLIKRLP